MIGKWIQCSWINSWHSQFNSKDALLDKAQITTEKDRPEANVIATTRLETTGKVKDAQNLEMQKLSVDVVVNNEKNLLPVNDGETSY